MNIKFFAYYSVGGYKDMFLGDSLTGEPHVYYSPFYCQWKAGKLDDNAYARMREQMDFLDTQKHIEVITASDGVLPRDASRFVSHSGFKLACYTLDDGATTIAIKDLYGSVKDDNNRSVPFMMQLIGDDQKTMIAITDYIRENLQAEESFFAELFEYNVRYNSLQFNIGDLNAWVNDVCQNKISLEDVEASAHRLHRLVLSNGVSKEYATNELGLSMRDAEKIFSASGHMLFNAKSESAFIPPIDYVPLSCEGENMLDGIMEGISKMTRNVFVLNPEDKEDIDAIRMHIRRIISRHFQ